MKTGLIIILFLIIQMNSYSQIREPLKHSFTYNGQTKHFNSTNLMFALTKHQISWHLAAGRLMSSSLSMTGSHSDMHQNLSIYTHSVSLVIDVDGVTGDGVSCEPHTSMMMVYQPLLKITDPKILNFRPADLIHSDLVLNILILSFCFFNLGKVKKMKENYFKNNLRILYKILILMTNYERVFLTISRDNSQKKRKVNI